MEAGFEKGREPPPWYENEPYLAPGLSWYVKAFWDLDSERQLGMSLGRVPRSAARKYGSDAGLGEAMMDVFWRLIMALDSAYLKYVSDEQEKQSNRAGKPGIGNKVKRK